MSIQKMASKLIDDMTKGDAYKSYCASYFCSPIEISRTTAKGHHLYDKLIVTIV